MLVCVVFLACSVLHTAAMDGPLLSGSTIALSYDIDVGFLFDQYSLQDFISSHLKHTKSTAPDSLSDLSEAGLSIKVSQMEDKIFRADISSARPRHSFYIKDFEHPVNEKLFPMFLHFVGFSTVYLEAQIKTSSIQILAGNRLNIITATVNNSEIHCSRDVIFYQLVTCELGQVLNAGSRINITFAYTSYFDDQCNKGSDDTVQYSAFEDITDYVHSNTCATVTLKPQVWGTDADNKVFLYTSFQPEGARHFFPSLDEPRFKSIYRISVTAPKNLLAISNEAVETSIKTKTGTLLRTEFKTTKVPLSTYLVTVVVGQFTASRVIDVDGIPWRVIRQTPTVGYQRAFFEWDAKSFLRRSIKYYQAAKEMFHIEPGLTTKVDCVGIFGFDSAMENPGLIIYQDELYFGSVAKIYRYDGDLVDLQSFEHIFYTVTHEIAHQWFGNLVTMQWWNDLWLNEGLSSWMEIELQKVVESKLKALRIRAYMKPKSEYMYYTEFEDEVVASTNTAIKRTGEEIFSRGVYSKGAVVIQMLQTVIGQEVFQDGLRTYLKEFQYSVATSNDFFRHIQQSVNHHGVYGPGNRMLNVKTFMHHWIFAESLPVVTVYRDVNKIHFSQKMKWHQPSPAKDNNTLWDIPISLRVQTGNVASLITFWLTDRNMTLDISYNRTTSLVFLHDNPYMLYKVNYDPGSLDIIYDMFSNNCMQTSIASLSAFHLNEKTKNGETNQRRKGQRMSLCEECLTAFGDCGDGNGGFERKTKFSILDNIVGGMLNKYRHIIDKHT